MFPFHTWLPDAHVEAPTAGSVILAGVLLKLGGYGLIRFAVPLFPDAATGSFWQPLIIDAVADRASSTARSWRSSSPTSRSWSPTSSVSHMGFVTLGIFVFNEQGLHGAVLQMIAHGIITGALFLLRRRDLRAHARPDHRQDGRPRRRRRRSTPRSSASSCWPASALPGLAGFVAEFLVLVGSFDFWPCAAAIAALAMMLGAAYLLWMYQRVVFGDLSDFLKGLGSPPDRHEPRRGR